MVDAISIDDLIDEFDYLTVDMDIPEGRRQDWEWLSRNLVVRNKNHKNLERAKEIIRLIRMVIE